MEPKNAVSGSEASKSFEGATVPLTQPAKDNKEEKIEGVIGNPLTEIREEGKAGGTGRPLAAEHVLSKQQTTQPLSMKEMAKVSLEQLKVSQARLKSELEFREKILADPSSSRSSDYGVVKPASIIEELNYLANIEHVITVREAKRNKEFKKNSKQELAETLKSVLSLLSVTDVPEVQTLCWDVLTKFFDVPGANLVSVLASIEEPLPLPKTNVPPHYQLSLDSLLATVYRSSLDSLLLTIVRGCETGLLKTAYTIKNFLSLNKQLLKLDDPSNKHEFDDYFAWVVDPSIQHFPGEKDKISQKQLKQLYDDIPMLVKLATADQLAELWEKFKKLGQPSSKSSREVLKSFQIAQMALEKPEVRTKQIKDVMDERISLIQKLGRFGKFLRMFRGSGVHTFNREKMDRAGDVILERLDRAIKAMSAAPKKEELELLHDEIEELENNQTFKGILGDNESLKERYQELKVQFFHIPLSDLQRSIEGMELTIALYQDDKKLTLDEVRTKIQQLEKDRTLQGVVEKPANYEAIQLKNRYHELTILFRLKEKKLLQARLEQTIASSEPIGDLTSQLREISALESDFVLEEIVEKNPELLQKYLEFKKKILSETVSRLKSYTTPGKLDNYYFKEVMSWLESLDEFRAFWVGIEKSAIRKSWAEGTFRDYAKELEFNMMLQGVPGDVSKLKREFLKLIIDFPNKIQKGCLKGYNDIDVTSSKTLEYMTALDTNQELQNLLDGDSEMKEYYRISRKQFFDEHVEVIARYESEFENYPGFTDLCAERSAKVEKLLELLNPAYRETWKSGYKMVRDLVAFESAIRSRREGRNLEFLREKVQYLHAEPFASNVKQNKASKALYDVLNEEIEDEEAHRSIDDWEERFEPKEGSECPGSECEKIFEEILSHEPNEKFLDALSTTTTQSFITFIGKRYLEIIAGKGPGDAKLRILEVGSKIEKHPIIKNLFDNNFDPDFASVYHQFKDRRTLYQLANPAISMKDFKSACAALSPDSINLPVDKFGNTLLHVVINNGNVGAITILLEKGADPLAVNNDGNSPLHVAVLNRDVVAGRILGSEIERRGQCTMFKLQNTAGDTPFHMLARDNDVKGHETFHWFEVFREILNEQGVNPLLMKNKNEKTPIHEAMYIQPVVKDQTQIEYNLTHDANVGFMSCIFAPFQTSIDRLLPDAYAKAFEGEQSPIHFALEALANETHGATKERVGRVCYFLSEAYPNECVNVKNKEGLTPLDLANRLISQGKVIPPEVLYLCDPEKINERSEIRRSFAEKLRPQESQYIEFENRIKVAVQANNTDELKSLKRQIEDFLEKENVLSAREKKDIPSELLSARRSKLYEKDKHDLSPIHRKIQESDVEFFKILCDPTELYHIIQNWDDERLQGPQGRPILHFALQALQQAVVKGNVDKVGKMSEIIKLLIAENPSLTLQKHGEITPLEALKKILAGKLSAEIQKILREIQDDITSSGKARFTAEMTKSEVNQSINIKNKLARLSDKIDEQLKQMGAR